MGEHTGIQWTDATFNPWWGCTKISPGCDNCYAEGVSKRFAPGMWGVNGSRREFDAAHFREPLNWNRKAMRDQKVMRVFSGSMCDVFENHPIADKYRPQLFALIMQTPWLHWQLLTKRIGNVRKMVPHTWLERSWPRNAWIGATIVTQAEVERDLPKLAELRAPVRFLSCEPLLEHIDISAHLAIEPGRDLKWRVKTKFGDRPEVQWVICGGESGNRARPMEPGWARSLRDQCAVAGVPFFFKQWGEWAPYNRSQDDPTQFVRLDACDKPMGRFGKKLSGRLLDGVEHNAFPIF